MAQSAGKKVITSTKSSEMDLRMAWDCIKVFNSEDRDAKLYSVLRHLVTQSSCTDPKVFFIPGVASSLLNILSVPHSPQVYILALSLLGFYCDSHPDQTQYILRKGLITDLSRLLRTHGFTFLHNVNQLGASHNFAASSELLCKISEFLLLLSRGPVESIEALVFDNVIIDIMRLINPQNGHLFAFSPNCIRHLKKLTVKKDLIGHCVPMSSDARSGEYLRIFGDACYDIILPQVALDVDLYDTQDPDRDVLIRDELMEQSDEYKWWSLVDSFSSDALNEETVEWTDIRVTHVIDGQYFWARTGGEESTEAAKHIAKTLAEWPVNRRQSVAPFLPAGTVVVATEKERTYRCQVLSSNEDTLSLFALDYGFIDSLPREKVFLLTPEMKLKVKPLAVLCRLHGASPPPFNKRAFKNFLHVLQNLTHYMHDSRSQFCSSEPWVSLQPLLKSSDAEVVSTVLAIFTNLSQDKQLAEVMTSEMFFTFLLSLCPVPCEDNYANHALTILHHILYKSEDAKDTFSRCGGPDHLMKLLLSKPPDAVQKSANRVLSAYISITKNPKQVTSPSQEPTPELIILRARKELEQESGVGQQWKHKHSRRSNPLPEDGIRKAVDLSRHNSAESEDENKFSNLSGGDTESEMLLTASKEKDQVVPIEVPVPCDPLAKMVIKGERLNVQVDKRTEIITYRNAEMVPGSLVAKLACSFLNSGPAGAIYLGLNVHSEAFGVELLRKQRDELRVGMDQALNQLFPPLTPSQYKIIFHPIYHNVTKLALNLYVVELRLKSTVDCLYSVRGNVYLREGMHTYKCKANDIHAHFVRVEEENSAQEIQELEQEVEKLSRILNSINKN